MIRKENQQQFNKFLVYSTMAFQMLGILLVFVWLGIQLDKYFQTEKPFFTASLALFGVCGAMYKLIRDMMTKMNS
ncbi:MAG: AtpZ/AtpI family protein [Cytophagales bacterium]|nr:AtpZ/AtpI family protein [Cytophagales bacterium]MDW8383290.1 AtpZ/AtpI family protein [Flammeovirgaceae bacterium]